MKKINIGKWASVLLLSALSFAQAENKGEVNIYSLRQPELLNPVLDAFTEKTGIKTNTTWVKDGLLARIKAEGKSSPADVVISVDVNRLEEIAEAGYFQTIPETLLSKQIKPSFYDDEQLWTALTLRTRIIITSKDLENKPKNYLDLAKPDYKGMLCIRPASHPYNVGLVAAMIAHHGEEATETWLKGLKDNLARRPSGNDRGQAKGIYEGACQIALINSYYLGKMATNEESPEQKDWYQSLHIVQPDQDSFGAHANISGFGILKNAKHVDASKALLEFMLSNEAQSIYASTNFELPVVDNVESSELIQSWGQVNIDQLNLEEVANNTHKAVALIDELMIDF